MISHLLKRMIKQSFNSLGLEVYRKHEKRDISSSQHSHPRSSRLGVLHHARNMGLSFPTIIDVGAAYGQFTLQCANLFPDAKYILVEPLEEYIPFLKEVTRSIRNARVVSAAATSQSGEVLINVHPDFTGSSLYLEDEDSNVNGGPRPVRSIALDSLLQDATNKPPFLLKIDVQGAELDVLLGAEGIVQGAEYILLEVSFFPFFTGGPLFHDVLSFMRSRGFVVYDIFDLQYRPLDNALSQADIVFVKEGGLLRRHHFYATREQRERQSTHFELQRRELVKKYKMHD